MKLTTEALYNLLLSGEKVRLRCSEAELDKFAQRLRMMKSRLNKISESLGLPKDTRTLHHSFEKDAKGKIVGILQLRERPIPEYEVELVEEETPDDDERGTA